MKTLDNTNLDTYKIICGISAQAIFTEFAKNGQPATHVTLPAENLEALANKISDTHINASLINQATETFKMLKANQNSSRQPNISHVEFAA